ncbi:MAG: hypothetical protein ACTSQI_14710 [Candidatus Helarchaeota archaeon]
MQNIFINNFPFSKNAAKYLQELDIDIQSLPEQFPTSFKEAYKRVIMLIDQNIIPKSVDTSLKSSEILIYAIMRFLIEVLDEDILRNRFAEAYSKRTERILISEKSSRHIFLLATTFNWNLLKEDYTTTRTYQWKLSCDNFLEVSPSLMANDWKLINQFVENGWVFLTKEKVIRLLAEKAKKYILNRKISDEEIPKLPNTFDLYLDELKFKVEELKNKFEAHKVYSDEIMKSAYPPCVNAVLEKTEKGENLTHTERLFITFFLLNIGHSISEVVDIFRNQPDFKEDITQYQVEFSAGKRGGGTKYTSYGCPKLISYGICKKYLDPWCKANKVFNKMLKNPLQYYSGKIYLIKQNNGRKNR